MKLVKLAEICTFSRGLTYSKGDEVDFSNNVVLRANNIDVDSNSLNLDNLRYIKDSIQIKKEKIAKKNSLIICTASGSKTHVGKVALIHEDYGYAFGGFMGQLTPTDECNPKFLYYVLTSGAFKDFLMSLNDGTNINNLKFSDIENFELPLPSLEKQHEIVDKIDRAFTEIDSLDKNLDKSENKIGQFLNSLVNSAFTNITLTDQIDVPLVALKDFCKMYQPATISTKQMVPNGEYLVYGANGPIGRYDRFNHEEPQLLVTCRGATCGAVNMSQAFAWINGNAMVIQPIKEFATIEYMKYAFLGGVDVSSAITGSAQPQITRTTLEVIKVPLPKLDKQLAIVATLDAAFAEAEKIRNRISIKKDYVGMLRRSILSEVFSPKDEMVTA